MSMSISIYCMYSTPAGVEPELKPNQSSKAAPNRIISRVDDEAFDGGPEAMQAAGKREAGGVVRTGSRWAGRRIPGDEIK